MCIQVSYIHCKSLALTPNLWSSQISLVNMFVTKFNCFVGPSSFFSRQLLFSKDSTFITKVIRFYVYTYSILTVNTGFLNQRPKDYLRTEYLRTSSPCPISPLEQYEEEKNHSVYVKGVCSTERVSIIMTLKALRVACAFCILPSWESRQIFALQHKQMLSKRWSEGSLSCHNLLECKWWSQGFITSLCKWMASWKVHLYTSLGIPLSLTSKCCVPLTHFLNPGGQYFIPRL